MFKVLTVLISGIYELIFILYNHKSLQSHSLTSYDDGKIMVREHLYQVSHIHTQEIYTIAGNITSKYMDFAN